MSPEDLPNATGATTWLGVVVAAIIAGLGIRARASKVSMGVETDAAGVKLLQDVMRERDQYKADASKAWSEREADKQLIERLSGELRQVRAEMRRMRTYIIRRLPDAAEFFSTDQGGLDEPTIPPKG